MRTQIATLTLLISCALGSVAAHAETPEEIVRALMPKPLTRSFKPAEPGAPPSPGGMTRSFRPAEPAPAPGLTRGVQIEGGDPAPEGPPRIDLYVNFEYNNAALTLSDARVALDALGKALQDQRLAGMRFAIIGHTDAVGNDQYNIDLSRRRAESVRQYLVQFHRVAAARLDADGRGMRELKDPSRPTDGINRRVEIRNLIGQGPPPPPSPPAVSREGPGPRVAAAEPLPLTKPVAVAKPDVRWSERGDFGFGDRQPERIDRLPDRPNGWTADNAAEQMRRQLGLAQQAAAFTNRGETAAAMFLALFENRFSRKGMPSDVAEIITHAEMVLAAGSGVGQLTALQALNRYGLRDARAAAFVIAQAWRNLEQDATFAAADEMRRADLVQQAFASAGREVVMQTRAAYEASRLKRSAGDFVAAVADLRVRGIAHPELDELAIDQARGLLQVLERQVPALQQEAEADTATALEMRRKLLDCIAVRLGTVVEQSNAGGSSAGQPLRDAALTSRPLLASIAADSAAYCEPLLAPSGPQRAAPPAPVDAAPPLSTKQRKAEVLGGPPPAAASTTLAGQPLE